MMRVLLSWLISSSFFFKLIHHNLLTKSIVRDISFSIFPLIDKAEVSIFIHLYL